MGAFADPRFRRMFAGYALSSFGDSALYLTLGIWAKTLTGSNSAAGGVFLALAIPSLCAPLAGHLADRVHRKPLLITTNVLTAMLVLALLAVGSRSQLWIIYLVAFGYGVSFSVQSGADAGLRKDMLRGEELASANAALSSMDQGIRVLSPLAGAAIFAAVGGRWVAVLDVATFAAAIAALAGIQVQESEPGPPGAFWREVSAGVRHVRAVPLLAQLALTGAIAFSVIGLEETIVFAVIGQGLHRSPAFFGVLTSVQGAGSIAAGVVAAMLLRKTGPARMAGIALACFAVGSLAQRTSSLPLVLAASVCDGLGVVWLSVGLRTAAQVHTPPRLQGRVGAALSLFLTGPQTVSIAVGAALISVVSYRLMLLLMAVVIGGCAAVLLARPAAEPAEPHTEPAEPHAESAAAGREPVS
jgi:MFS family permease